jgi:integrase/recombinase XerD
MRARLVQTKTTEITVHDYDTVITSTLKKVEDELSAKDVELIKKYNTEMVGEALSKATRLKNLATILSLSRIKTKDWQNLTKDDINSMVSQVMTTYSENGQETYTTWDHKKILRIFFRWIKLGSRDSKDVGDPEETKHIRLKPVKNKIVREQLITEEDLNSLLKACVGNQRDKAFLHTHYEAGTRPGEILSLRIKHVKFDQIGAIIHVDGKTGARPIRLVRSVPDLARWFNMHPHRDNPESPLWIILTEKRLEEALTYGAAERMLKRVAKKAKLNKRVNLKLFRHSEATNSAKYMTEAQMRIRHGWTKSSNMPANYVHLVSADVDEAYLKHLGIVKKDEEKPALPKICPICKTPNSTTDEICNSCGKPLDLKKAIEQEEKAEQGSFLANKIAGKFLVQMLLTGQVPKLPKEEIAEIIKSLNL